MYLFQRCCCCCGYVAVRVPLLSIPPSNTRRCWVCSCWCEYKIRAYYTNVLGTFHLEISNSLSYSQFHIGSALIWFKLYECLCVYFERSPNRGKWRWLCMTATGLNTKAPETNRCLTLYTSELLRELLRELLPEFAHTKTQKHKQPKSCTARTNFNTKIN